MNFFRSTTAAALALLLGGCHLFGKVTPDCHRPQEYQKAGQVAPLTVPPGMDAPNTQGALVIPSIGAVPPPPGPKDACLEVPPRYKPAPPNKAGAAAG